jgi:uncharacterized protein YccT (UPF0319 family)
MKLLGLLFILVISPFTYSSEFIVSNNIQVLAINGIKFENSFFGDNKIELENGPHQLVVKYSNTFRNKDLLESTPYIFMIDVDGKTTLETDDFSTYAQADKYIKEGVKWYIDNNKGKFTIEKSEQLKGRGFMPFHDIESIINEYNQANNLPAMNDQNNTNGPLSKNYLIEQYKAASQEQKDQFKQWLIQH